MAPKASLSKRPAFTQEEHKIQLGLEIENNNNITGVYKQICALTANQKVNCCNGTSPVIVGMSR